MVREFLSKVPLAIRDRRSRICVAVAGLFFCGLLGDGMARAQMENPPAEEEPPSWSIEIETDPTFIALKGYLLLAAVKPRGTGFASHLRFGIGLLSFEHPQFAIDLNESNEGWSAEVPWGVGADLMYVFGDDQRGFVAGLVALLRREEYSPPSGVGETSILHLSAIPFVGYQWFPFDDGWTKGLYLMPRLGAFVLLNTSKDAVVGGEEFEQAPVSPAAAMHMGYGYTF